MTQRLSRNRKKNPKTHSYKRSLARLPLMSVSLSAAALLIVPCLGAETAGRPKIYGIAYVKVKVTDLEKAKAFYGGVLGMASSGSSCKGVADPCFVVNPYQHVELVRTGAGDRRPTRPASGRQRLTTCRSLGNIPRSPRRGSLSDMKGWG